MASGIEEIYLIQLWPKISLKGTRKETILFRFKGWGCSNTQNPKNTKKLQVSKYNKTDKQKQPT